MCLCLHDVMFHVFMLYSLFLSLSVCDNIYINIVKTHKHNTSWHITTNNIKHMTTWHTTTNNNT